VAGLGRSSNKQFFQFSRKGKYEKMSSGKPLELLAISGNRYLARKTAVHK